MRVLGHLLQNMFRILRGLCVISVTHMNNNRRLTICAALLGASLSGCAVIGIADAAVTVLSTAVSIGAKVVGTTVDIAAAGVKAVIPDKNDSE